jgi:hypothetical protein
MICATQLHVLLADVTVVTQQLDAGLVFDR